MSYDNMTSICQFLENDPKSLAMLNQTNKEINNIVLNTTSYTTQKENTINQRNYEQMVTYIIAYSELKMENDNQKDDVLDRILEEEYLAKINKIVPYIDHSYLDNLNTMICSHYFDVLENDPPAFICK